MRRSLYHGSTALSFEITTESMRAEPHHENRNRSLHERRVATEVQAHKGLGCCHTTRQAYVTSRCP
jgi:hypothetical protein